MYTIIGILTTNILTDTGTEACGGTLQHIHGLHDQEAGKCVNKKCM